METLSREAQQRLDRAAEAAGIPSLILMERAGSAVADYIKEHYESNFVVHIFCGKGKNAGDAYVVARLLLAALFEVHVWEYDSLSARKAELAKTDSGIMRKAMRGMGLEPKAVSKFLSGITRKNIDFLAEDTEALVVDGLLGTGYDTKRPLEEKLAALCAKLNELQAAEYIHIISIDIPTGVDATTGLTDPFALTADVTVTFEYNKTGLISFPGETHSRKIVDVSLGLSESFLEAFWKKESTYVDYPDFLDIAKLLPARPRHAHKGNFGKSLAICGGAGTAGAAVLSAKAAMRSGLGMLTALVPRSIYAACLKAAPAVMWVEMQEEDDDLAAQIEALLKDKSSVLFGSGSTELTAAQMEIILHQLENSPAPLVLDAAALNYLGENKTLAEHFFKQRLGPTLLTPHPGEFSRLAPDLAREDISRIEQAERLAKRCRAFVVLKGAATVVASPHDQISINRTGNSGMAKAGSGDVLAGIILAFSALGQPDSFAVLQLAVFAHGLAADLIKRGASIYAVSAEAMIESIPEVLEILSHPDEIIDAILSDQEED